MKATRLMFVLAMSLSLVGMAEDGVANQIILYDGSSILPLHDGPNLYWPEINDSGQVVWYGSDGSDREIFFYDGTSVIQITDNAYNDYYPQINDTGQMVWQGSDGSDYEIFLYDGTSIIQLTDNDQDDVYPEINSTGQVVWSGHDGSDWEIFFYDGTATTQLTNNSYDDYTDEEGPRINDSGEAVWSGYDGSDHEIFLYDGTTVIQLTDNAGDSFWQARINNNGHVAWIGDEGSGSMGMFYYDGTNVTNINDLYCGWPEINDDGKIVFLAIDPDGGQETVEVFLYDGTDTLQLTNNLFYEEWDPQINAAGHVTWVAEDLLTGGYKIFLRDDSGMHQLYDGEYPDHPRINDNGFVVWSGYYQPCLDNDGDGYGNPANINCTHPELDCDDNNPDVNPGVREGPFGDDTCTDTYDNDCDGRVDGSDAGCYTCVDNDGDGYGDPKSTGCYYPERDCDDTDPEVHPHTMEDCTNGVDDNCNGQTDADDGLCSPKSRQPVTLDAIGDVGRHSVLELDTADHVHIAYYDVTDQRINYATNASGSWMHEVVATGLAFSSEFRSVLSIAADSTGAVHIGYHDSTNEEIRHATNASGSWIISAVDSLADSPPWGVSTGIAVDSTHKVHMVYPSEVGLKYASNVSGSWQTSTIDPALTPRASIDVDKDDKVHISYNYFDTLMYASNASGTWETEIVAGPYIYLTGTYNSIAVDSSNHAHISYEVMGREGIGPFRVDLAYATDAPGSWGSTLVDGGEDYVYVGYYNSIAVDSTGAVHVSYIRLSGDTFGPLKYATNRNGTWKSSEIRSGLFLEDARDTSIAIDSSDRAHICYYDPDEGDLKYVMISPSTGGAWGTASVVGSPSTSDALNYLLCLLVPIGAVLVWTGMRRKR